MLKFGQFVLEGKLKIIV